MAIAMTVSVFLNLITEKPPSTDDHNDDNPPNPIVYSIPILLIVFFVAGLCCTFCCYVLRTYRATVGSQSVEDIETVSNSSSQGQILIKVNYKKKFLKKNSSLLKSDVCTICLDEFKHKDEISFCICGHAYHHKCIMKWLEIKRTCPMCQRKVKGFKANERTPLLIDSSSGET